MIKLPLLWCGEWNKQNAKQLIKVIGYFDEKKKSLLENIHLRQCVVDGMLSCRQKKTITIAN